MSLRAVFRLERATFALDVALEFAPGTTALCGPSGAGKSSLLRCIAGLEPGVRGTLDVSGECWLDSARGLHSPPHLRSVGFVSQEPNLFEHLTVFENLRYGARRTRVMQVKESDVIDRLGLTPLIHRDVGSLSGGERQRVAIGRALLRSPQILLLDEPVSALDVASRYEVLTYVQRVLQSFRLPCVYVSHDLREAARVSDQMMWLEKGRLIAHGPAAHVLTDLKLPFAELEEAESVLSVKIEAHDDEYNLTQARCNGDRLWLPKLDLLPGTMARVQIAARDVSLALNQPSDVSIQNVLAARIVDLQPSAHNPGQVLVRLQVGDEWLLARVTSRAARALHLQSGLQLWALVKAVALLQP